MPFIPLLLWILFGALVGFIASIITRTSHRTGIVSNIIIGLAGSLLGGFIASELGHGTTRTFSIQGFLIALSGAVILLTLLKLMGR